MDYRLIEHLYRYVGDTVTIFTTSGGVSGCGFTGVLLFVNPCYVRLVNQQGTPPTNPLSTSICGEWFDEAGSCGQKKERKEHFIVGSVCDIPVDKIAAFCHNAI